MIAVPVIVIAVVVFLVAMWKHFAEQSRRDTIFELCLYAYIGIAATFVIYGDAL